MSTLDKRICPGCGRRPRRVHACAHCQWTADPGKIPTVRELLDGTADGYCADGVDLGRFARALLRDVTGEPGSASKAPDHAWMREDVFCVLLGSSVYGSLQVAHMQGAGSIAISCGPGGGFVVTCDPAIYARIEGLVAADAAQRGVSRWGGKMPQALIDAVEGRFLNDADGCDTNTGHGPDGASE
jgi:hypothetical protein